MYHRQIKEVRGRAHPCPRAYVKACERTASGKSLTTKAAAIKQILKKSDVDPMCFNMQKIPNTEVKTKGTSVCMAEKFPSDENRHILIVVCTREPCRPPCMGSGEVLGGHSSSPLRMQHPKSQPLR